MKIKELISISLILVGGIGLAFIIALALYLYLPNTLVKVLVCLSLLSLGVLLVYRSKVLTSGVLKDIFHRGIR